jgi:hypothetical protein
MFGICIVSGAYTNQSVTGRKLALNVKRVTQLLVDKDQGDRSRWEDFYISVFYTKHGELTGYNRIKGDYPNKNEEE